MELTHQIIFSIIVAIILLLYRYLIGNYDYWKRRGIPSAGGVVPGFGHLWLSFCMKKHFTTIVKEIYEAHAGSSMVGLFTMRRPVLLIKDVDLIKTVLQSEFNNFRYHETTDSSADPLLCRNPFVLNDQEWKDSRSKFVTIVTAKKLKIFSSVACDGAAEFVKYLNSKLDQKDAVDIEGKNMFEKVTIEISANAILSVTEGSFDDNSEKNFRKMMKCIFEPSMPQALRATIFQFIPFLNKIFRIGFVPHWINAEFTNLVGHLIDQRRNDGNKKNDLLQNLIELCREKNLPDQAVISDAFSFFIETFGTSSLTMSFLALDLARYPAVQVKLREEINSVIGRFDGKISYESVNEMTYLDQVLSESMRLNPVGGILRKICSEATELIGSDGLQCRVKPGDRILLSVYGVHGDPLHWKNPDQFRPERFDKMSEEYKQRHKYCYIPFGEGPRMCPGMRMGVLQVKLLIAIIVKNFVIEQSPKIKEPITLDPAHFLSFVNGGAWIRLRHFKQ